LRQTESGWLASTPKKLSAQSRRFGESFAPANQPLREFAAAIGHVLAAEDAEAEHLARRELRLELRIEVAAGRRRQLITVPLLHFVVDGDGALAHSRRVPGFV
jgi:hypothetical protein